MGRSRPIFIRLYRWNDKKNYNDIAITNALAGAGYKKTSNNNDCNATDEKYYLLKLTGGKDIEKCSIADATKYIIKTQFEIFKIKENLFKTERQYKDYKYKYDNFNKIYNTVQLINKPVYTDKVTTNDDWSYANFKGDDDYTPESKINYTYALSCWVYIHQNASNSNFRHNEYATIINYGDKPKISYKQSTDTLRIEVQHRKKDINYENDTKRIYETTNLPLQKWNYIVMNFDGGTLDVFINNKLVATDGNVIPFIISDSITIGEEGGVSGGLCNLVYYPSTLSKIKINMFYNIFKIKTPPIL